MTPTTGGSSDSSDGVATDRRPGQRRMRFSPAPKPGALLAATLLWLAIAGFAAAAQQPAVTPLVESADRLFAFAETLMSDGHFDQAIYELRRFVHYFGDDHRVPAARLKIGVCYHRSGKYREAARELESLTRTDLEPGIMAAAHFALSEAYLKTNDTGRARLTLQNLIQLNENKQVADRAYYRLAWIDIEAHRWSAASSWARQMGPQNAAARDALMDSLTAAAELPYKNPSLAGTLAVLPGAGHLYCGRPRDALIAFVLNAGLIWAAVEAFENDLPVLGSLIGVVELGFYSGNIYSSISSAHKANRRVKENFVDGLKRKFNFQVGFHSQMQGPTLAVRFAF